MRSNICAIGRLNTTYNSKHLRSMRYLLPNGICIY